MRSVSKVKGAQGVAHKRPVLVIWVLALAMLVAALISLTLGRYTISVPDIARMIAGTFAPIQQTWTNQQASLFFNVRLPRVLLALAVGCSLSAAGASFQGIFQNPLVSPDFLGASQGAAFGASLAILMSASMLQTSLSAFFFSMLSVVIVLLVSRLSKGNRILVTVLAGVMVSSLFQAGVSYIKLVADPNAQLQAITFWLMGSLTSARTEDLALVALPMLVGNGGLLAIRWRLNALTMGDDEAMTMGVNAPRLRAVAIVLATLVTASSVSVTGIIGWVGLVVPHLARGLVGADYRHLLPASMLLGGTFLLVVDDIARLATTAEIPIGILTAFIGAPFFLWLITRKTRG
ncbi:MAG: FecCD family ABC transporter permease [Tractidigestivibacter sp.]|jgi:iron complex transport system permease protein|uniref:FecCD family ABC transporter permease n=1 Tax=Tractidigestivibacter sp. TaxID=2847320 RepID=UPI003D91FB84